MFWLCISKRCPVQSNGFFVRRFCRFWKWFNFIFTFRLPCWIFFTCAILFDDWWLNICSASSCLCDTLESVWNRAVCVLFLFLRLILCFAFIIRTYLKYSKQVLSDVKHATQSRWWTFVDIFVRNYCNFSLISQSLEFWWWWQKCHVKLSDWNKVNRNICNCS